MYNSFTITASGRELRRTPTCALNQSFSGLVNLLSAKLDLTVDTNTQSPNTLRRTLLCTTTNNISCYLIIHQCMWNKTTISRLVKADPSQHDYGISWSMSVTGADTSRTFCRAFIAVLSLSSVNGRSKRTCQVDCIVLSVIFTAGAYLFMTGILLRWCGVKLLLLIYCFHSYKEQILLLQFSQAMSLLVQLYLER